MDAIEKRARELLAAEYAKGQFRAYAPEIRNGTTVAFDEEIRAIVAIIAALTPQWQPIESAPKDGTFYLATNGREQRVENCPEGHVAGIWHRINGDWRGSALGDDSTHWHPLSAPPEAPNVND